MPKLLIDTAELYSTLEAAKLLKIGYATLYRWIRDHKIIPIKLNHRTLIPKSEIERLKKIVD